MSFVAKVPIDSPAEYAVFWRQWQRGEYFACHETLEELWRREASEAKPFYQGLIHGAVALHHAEGKNVIGATRQLAKARRRLAPFGDEYAGVEIAEFLREVESKIESTLAGSQASGMLEKDKNEYCKRGSQTELRPQKPTGKTETDRRRPPGDNGGAGR